MSAGPGPLRPIQTRLYGHLFRSRLEARWAVFMTEAGFDWTYEPEGFELAAGRYLPDFRVARPGHGVPVWMEVKPMIPGSPADDPRWTELAARSGTPLFTVRGMHRPRDDCTRAHAARAYAPDGSAYDVHRLWQADIYDAAWVKANTARFDGTDEPGFFAPPKRRGRRR